MADDQNNIRNAELANESDTPHFDALFAQYATDNGTFGTEHLGNLLLDMGFSASPKILDRALDDMDPNATGEIAKLTFLEWFEENADNIDDAPATPAQSSLHRTQQEDAYSELQSAMLDAKKQRKQADNDAQLLANHLAHLRAEDARAQKRIEEAKRRAREIEAIKKRNEDKQRVKQEALEQMQRNIKAQREYNNAVQSLSRERRNQVMAEYNSQRVQIVQDARAERKTNLHQIKQQREMDRSWLAERSQEIRDKEKRVIRQRQAVQKSYEKELLKKARDNLAQEHEKRLLSEKKIYSMEAEEAELIEKLRVTQELQRAAYEELEFVMQDDGRSS
ncbi:hypothetical protein JG688_00016157 [Phytophthora aleatoria]|uniref:EF-hand domain-containing protein n=1 Tax=Phytophthora aleatoria TaxID=2496075 RepID=A0A8J5IUN7_9STRA|nr:hypothetical protein JG688_00016157 [Phytophthora aleatoria]